MSDIVRYESRPLSAADMRANVNLVQEVMRAVMIGPSKENKDGVHYGKIPGAPKPTLYKPGAEVLCATFRIAPSYRVEDLSGEDFVRYRVTCIGTHQTTGITLGEGMGECSSNEEKYKWRKANPREFDAASENRRRVKYGYNSQEQREYEIKQVRTEPADLANTILKMACKRAQVAMTLNVTAASDIFTQDIEDLPEELRHAEDEPVPEVKKPQSKSKAASQAGQQLPNAPSQEGHAAGPASAADHQSPPPGTPQPSSSTALAGGAPLTDGQKRILKARMESAQVTEDQVAKQFGVKIFDELPASKINEISAWVRQCAEAKS